MVCLVLGPHLGPLSSQEEGVFQAHILDPSMALHWCLSFTGVWLQRQHTDSSITVSLQQIYQDCIKKPTLVLSSPLRQAFPCVAAVPCRDRWSAAPSSLPCAQAGGARQERPGYTQRGGIPAPHLTRPRHPLQRASCCCRCTLPALPPKEKGMGLFINLYTLTIKV